MTLEELRELADGERAKQKLFRHHINVCVAAGCLSQRSDQVKAGIETELQSHGIDKEVQVKGVGCMGLCAAGPLVSVDDTHMYQNVQPGGEDGQRDAAAIVASLDGTPLDRLALPNDLAFFTAQQKIVLENSGKVDPERIDDYFAAGGYEALLTALTTMNRTEVVEQVTRSGLRGRGGAGYPTGLKWSTVSKARHGENKYVICNADEGDPGAFMDRSVLESDPHRVLEGMAIGAYAVGASRGYIYVRAEYPLAIKRLKTAIKQAEQHGLLGNNICDTQFSFRIDLRLGAGAFVCGEETALIASVEGKRGMPRPRPPYPAQEGLWGCPTLINNVETFANVPAILRHGGDWFAKIGTEKSKGTKVFALAGRVKNTGLIEVPMGMTLRDIIFKLGGGIPDGRQFKAAQTGGPSGGCVPEQYLDMPIDYESLAGVGSIMGSGGLIIMDDSSCMVDVAKFFMDFCRSESCGKCVPCRVGTVHMHHLLERICAGKATPEDLALLEMLGDAVKNTSLCGLGQTAPNPTFSTLRYFRQEYMTHIEDKQCPAGACKGLTKAKGVGA